MFYFLRNKRITDYKTYYLSVGINLNNSHLKKDNKTLKIKAVNIPSTKKPATNQSASKTMSALITKRNNPKVSNVKGSVKNTRTGRTIMFNTANVKATPIAAT